MSKVRTQSARRYFIRVNGEAVDSWFSTLREARRYVNSFKVVRPDQQVPSTVEIIKQYTVEEVMGVFTPQPVQILMAADLDKDLYK